MAAHCSVIDKTGRPVRLLRIGGRGRGLQRTIDDDDDAIGVAAGQLGLHLHCGAEDATSRIGRSATDATRTIERLLKP